MRVSNSFIISALLISSCITNVRAQWLQARTTGLHSGDISAWLYSVFFHWKMMVSPGELSARGCDRQPCVPW